MVYDPYGYSRLVAECMQCGKRWLCTDNSDAENRKRFHEVDNQGHRVMISMERPS